MSKVDAKKLLDTMYPPERVDDSHIEANGKLSSTEVDILLDIVIIFKNRKEQFDYDLAFGIISLIAKRFVTVAQVNKSGKKSPVQPQPMPLLIQQVLFYLAVAGEEYDLYTHGTVLTYLKNKGLRVGQIYSKMPFEPSYYLSVRDYGQDYISLPNHPFSQPQVLFSYNGQKAGILGVAIKNLVYQAGKFKRFVDVFGGTGSATLAFPKRGYTKYVYNELNKTLYELYKVIKSDNYKLLIQEMQSLKNALKGEKSWLDETVDFEKKTTRFFNRPYTQGNKAALQQASGEKDIFDFRWAESLIDYDDILKYMKSIINNLQLSSNDYSFSYDGTTYLKQQLLTGFLSLKTDYDYFISYIEDFDFCNELGNDLFIPSIKARRVDDINGTDAYVSNADDAKLRETQARFYKYYSYFASLLKKSRRTHIGIRRSLAYIFLMNMLTNNAVDISATTRMTATRRTNISYAWKHFLYPTKKGQYKLPEQSEIIEVLHTAFNKIDLSNKDFSDVIQSVPDKETLYYVDSPYIDTTGYSGMDFDINAQNMPAFGTNEMTQLIQLLSIASQNGDKFIFSCRACLTAKGSTDNYNLVKYVYENFKIEFIDKGMDLWVVTIQEDQNKDFFNDLVANGEVAEIMIVNYKIRAFDVNSLYPKSKYGVYSYRDFIVKVLPLL